MRTCNPTLLAGAGLSDQTDCTSQDDILIGLAGDDSRNGRPKGDALAGDGQRCVPVITGMTCLTAAQSETHSKVGQAMASCLAGLAMTI